MKVSPWGLDAAERNGSGVAIETPSASLSHAELARLAGAGARELGVAHGERVAIALPSGIDFALALHACLRAGAIAVPIDVRDPAPALGGVAAVLDRPLDCTAASLAAAPYELDAVALIVRTSGTSGAPKEVPLTYGNLLWSALGSAVALGLDPAERWLCALPLVHVGGLGVLIRSAIYGTTAVLHERFETARVIEALMERRITLVSVVATTLTRMLDGGLRDPPALRCALAGGGPIPPALHARARAAGVEVSETYGLTEACSQVATQRPGSDGGAAAPPLFCTRVRIAADGEILVSGPTVSPAAGALLRTGDRGALDADGGLRVLGRIGETIISGGENVSPVEVEAVLLAHPAVAEAGVYGVADEQWGEAVRAAVVLREQVDPDALRAHCAARLAGYKVPKRFVVRDALPRTSSGKLRRRELAVDADRDRS